MMVEVPSQPPSNCGRAVGKPSERGDRPPQKSGESTHPFQSGLGHDNSVLVEEFQPNSSPGLGAHQSFCYPSSRFLHKS